MLTKIYFVLLGVSVVVMSYISYYAYSWLQSIGLPSTAFDGYLYNANLAFKFLIGSFFVLGVIATALAWIAKRPWALWVSFLYFAVFTILYYFWLDRAAFQFKQNAGLTDASYSFNTLVGVVLVIVAGVVTFCVHFMVSQLHRRMSMTNISTDDVSIEDDDIEKA